MPISEVKNIDCITAMKLYEDNYFDLAIVDPPYGINESNADFKSRNRPVKQKNGNNLNAPNNNYKRKVWDNKPPTQEYFKELFRVSKHQIIWGVNYYDYPFTSGRIIWDKHNGDNDFSDCEIAFCSKHKSTRKFNYMWAGMFQGKSIKEGHIMQGNKKLNEKRIHPTQKPVLLYGWLLQKYAKEKDKILDTHLGSGSSRIASWKLGFDFYGFEIDNEYFLTQEKRFINETQAATLFNNNTKLV